MAVRQEMMELVWDMENQGANLSEVNEKNESLLFDAVRTGNPHMVEYLISKGVNIETVNNENKKAYDLTNDPEMIRLFSENSIPG
jgi:hypothetical protein